MGRFAGSTVVLTFIATTSAYNPELCPPSTELSVSPCDAYNPCPGEKGPADCVDNQCLCRDGYCPYGPVSAGGGHYCAARALGHVCKRQGDCQEAGSGTTICVSGVCICVWNYRWDEYLRKCEKGWEPMGATGFAAQGNFSTYERDGFHTFQEKETSIVFHVAALSAGAAALAVVVGSLMHLQRRGHGQASEISGYKHLESEAPSLVSQ